MRDSIFYSSIRSLFVTFFATIGIGLAIVALFVFLAGLESIGEDTTQLKFSAKNEAELLPDADGKRDVHAKTVPVVLQLNVRGIIGADSLTNEAVREMLIESREGDLKGDRVKALLVFIDSPGGTVVDSDGIYRAIKEYKSQFKVPVYAYVDGLCASGGMYVASAADKVYASDVSIIGSVGVLAPSFMNFSKTLDKIGVETLTLTAGKGKDAMNPLRPWTPGEQDNFQGLINYYYQQFVGIVTAARPRLDKTRLIDDFGAHVFAAPIAQEYGFIDVSGSSRDEALRALLKEANIEGQYQVVAMKSKNWFASLFSSEASSLFKGTIKHQLQLTPAMDPALQNKYLYLYQP